MSRKSRAKQREALQLARSIFDKSLVRSFSCFENLRHRPGTLEPAQLCLVDMACSRLLVRTPPVFAYGVV